jgi:hypothetical protein
MVACRQRYYALGQARPRHLAIDAVDQARPARSYRVQFHRDNALANVPSVFPMGMKWPPEDSPGAISASSGDRIRTCDLWVMSLAPWLRP